VRSYAARGRFAKGARVHFATNVSNTLDRVDWNVELVRGDLANAVRQLKRGSGKGLFVGGVKLPLVLAELGLIDE
jgi:hypothetical protein